MSLKAKINNIAIKNNASPQATLAIYMFERILMRIEQSKYKDNIILKGGLLLSSLIGIDMRTTRDMDANLKGIILEKENIDKIFNEILSIDLNDDIKFKITGIDDIRKKDKYDAFVIEIDAIYETMTVPISIDISTGDVITPKEMKYKYKKIFEDGYINLIAYTIETVIAEKFETIITRGVNNTRAKDFYDLYMLMKTYKELNTKILVSAIDNTFNARKTENYLSNMEEINEELENSDNLLNIWNIFSKTNNFANGTTYKQVVSSVKEIINILADEKISV